MRVRLTAACAGVEQQLGRQDEAHSRLLTALEELTDRHSEAGVALMIALATDAFYRTEFPDIVRWGSAAVTAASTLGNPALTAASEAVLTLGYSFTGDTDAAEAHRLVAAALIDSMTDEELAVRSDALGHLAGAELYLERFEETAAHARGGIALARAAGQGDFFPTLFPCLGSATWVLGRLAESAEVLDAAVELARLSGNVQGVAWGLLNRSLGALWAGDWTTALDAGKEGMELTGTLGDGFVASLAGVIYGWALVETGDPVRGAAVMVAGGGGEDLGRIPGGWRATYLEVLTRAWLAQGRIDDARRAADWAREVADAVGLPRTEALAHSASASVALHTGDTGLAVEEARASVAVAEKASARVDAAMSRILLGRALIEAGDTVGAALELEKAAADFDAYGSSRHRDMAEQHLRKLGHHVSRRSAPGKARGEGLGALSERELEVARLVVRRRTNPEIAADLFLSLKTVETHMRNIFRKLGVTSRVEVAQVLERATPA
jgi:DNA-binding NarL/FixJ family response regulator